MISPHALLAFLAVSFVLAIVPGPAVIYITTRSASQGRLAGFASVLGVATGGLVHILAAAVGLSALLMRSAIAMQYVRWAGAAYLIFLGVQKLRSANIRAEGAALLVEKRSLSRLYVDGLIVNVLNPKTALFFLSFLPQFVDPARGSVGLQIALLGCIFQSLALITDSTYALASAAVASLAKASASTARLAAYASGVVYIGLGIAAAAGARSK
jgi:threonine/homoserine/homoserine lactone efflux protein